MRTTPGTRRRWSTGQEWAAHLRDLLRRTGRKAKGYTDLEAHMVACDREFIRSLNFPGLYAIRKALETPKARGCGLCVPPRGHRAGSPYELIVNEVHNAMQNARARERRYERYRAQLRPRRVPVQLRLPWDETPALQEVA